MRRLFIFCLVLLISVQLVSAVSVTVVTVETLGCGVTPDIRVTVTGSHVEPPAADDIADVDVYDGDGTHVAHHTFAWIVGSSNASIAATLSWLTSPQANPLRVVVTDQSSGLIAAEQPFSTACLTRTVEAPPTTYSSSGVQISIVNEGVDTPQYGFSLYGIGLDGRSGFAVVSLSADELAALPETPEENTLIATGTEATYWGEVAVYQLTTGEIQVNVGPDAEGKIRVTIYDAIPPARIYGYEFNVIPTP